MSNGYTAPQSQHLHEESKIIKKPPRGKPSEVGEIGKTIGTGENAQNSIVWITIRWSLILGGLVSLALYLRPVYCQTDYSGNLVEDIKATWAIFMPIITLALGYVFGKGK